METFNDSDGSAMSNSKPDIVTHVAVSDMTQHDKHAVEPALEDTETRGVKPSELLADSHYGSTECIETGRARVVEIVAPAQTPKGKLQGKLRLEDFQGDGSGCVTCCPNGASPIATSTSDSRIQVSFDVTTCTNCPLLSRCPAAAVGRNSPRWQCTPDCVQHRTRRKKEESDEFRNRYRWRAGVEATLSRYKHQMGMPKLRVRGIASVAYVATMRALSLNIRRVAAYRAAIA